MGRDFNSTSPLEGLSEKERIIGGEITATGDLKYQLSMRFRQFHHCGATLIQVEDVQLGITAAHCTEGESKTMLTLKFFKNFSVL